MRRDRLEFYAVRPGLRPSAALWVRRRPVLGRGSLALGRVAGFTVFSGGIRALAPCFFACANVQNPWINIACSRNLLNCIVAVVVALATGRAAFRCQGLGWHLWADASNALLEGQCGTPIKKAG